MFKRSIAIFLLIFVVGGLMIACEPQQTNSGISQDEAVKIAYEDLGVSDEDVAEIHVHQGMHDGELCYNVYINAKNAAKTYVVSAITGKILAIQDGISHSH